MRITADPFVVIEDCGNGWVRYRDIKTNRRWEVWGECYRLGNCMIGAILDNGEPIRDHAHLATWGDRPDSDLDVPVTPEFTGCCSFVYRVLE